MQFVRKENLLSLACQHQFCRSCWEQHCTVLVKDGVGVGECKVDMGTGSVFAMLAILMMTG